MLATDLFTLDGDDYLLVTDYFSKYPILNKLKDTKSQTVTNATAAIMFGIFQNLLLGWPTPKIIVLGNGLQYSGDSFQRMCENGELIM